jgi:hypothetical protein
MEKEREREFNKPDGERENIKQRIYQYELYLKINAGKFRLTCKFSSSN